MTRHNELTEIARGINAGHDVLTADRQGATQYYLDTGNVPGVYLEHLGWTAAEALDALAFYVKPRPPMRYYLAVRRQQQDGSDTVYVFQSVFSEHEHRGFEALADAQEACEKQNKSHHDRYPGCGSVIVLQEPTS